jgi:hypothetical protein
MADKKISELDSASLPLAGTEIVPIVQGGVTKKVAVSEIGGDTPFDPSDYDLDEFTNASEDPFVRQSEIPSVTTPDLDAVTQEGNVSRVPLGVGDGVDAIAEFGYDENEPDVAPYIKNVAFDFKLLFGIQENIRRDYSLIPSAYEYCNGIFTDDFTASVYQNHIIRGTDVIVTDPFADGASNSAFYYVFVEFGRSCIIDGVTYTAGNLILRKHNGTEWESIVITNMGNPTLNDVALNGNTSTVPLKVSGDEGIASYGVDPDSGYPLLESDQNDGNGIVHQLSHLTDKRIRFVVNDNAWEVTQISKNTNYTAINGQNYYNSGNIVVTDPASGIYFVFVATGTTTIDSVAYSANTYLVRYLNASSVWVTRVLNATASPTVEGTTKLYDSLGTGTDGAVNRTVVTEELRRKANNLVLYNRTAWFAQRGSSGFGTIGITVANFVLSGNSVVAPTNTNGYTIQVRTNFATSATAGTLSFYRIGTDATIINTRFIFDGLFGFAGTTADTRFFYGLSTASTATPTNVAPTSLTNILAVSKLDTSNNLHVIHNDASGTATSIDLGANFPCDTNQTDTYYARFEVDTIGTVIYTVCRLNSDGEITHKVEGTITSDLPTDNTLLYHRAWITNNATASVSSFDFMGGSLGKN